MKTLLTILTIHYSRLPVQDLAGLINPDIALRSGVFSFFSGQGPLGE